MARRTSPPFRADHVGSLLRPQRLLMARDDFAAGTITAADLRAVEDEVIPAAIQMQEEVDLQSATDGEFRGGPGHGPRRPGRGGPRRAGARAYLGVGQAGLAVCPHNNGPPTLCRGVHPYGSACVPAQRARNQACGGCRCFPAR